MAEVRRCLTDTGLPLPVRIIRLYALPLTRIIELTTDQFHRDAEAAYLTLDRHPALLPPALAALLDEQIAELHDPLTPQGRRHLLLPGAVPGRPRNPAGLADQMRQHDLPVRALEPDRSRSSSHQTDLAIKLSQDVHFFLDAAHPETCREHSTPTRGNPCPSIW
jgi:hypothetical protein